MFSSDQPSKSSEKLQDLSEEIIRRQSALKLFFDFPASGFGELLVASLKKVIEIQGLNEPKSLGAMDLYDRPVKEVTSLLLDSQGIDPHQLHTQQANMAYEPNHFRNTAWTIAPGDNITLLVYNERVVGVQKRVQGSDDNHQ